MLDCTTSSFYIRKYNHHANEHHPLFIGVAQVLEFPKELNCEINCSRPEFRKGTSGAAEDSDVMRSYLVTSRDGRRFDFDWIYAKQPLLPPRSHNKTGVVGGLLIPENVWSCASVIDTATSHQVFFFGSEGHHERWGNTTVIAMASFGKGRLSGVVAGAGCTATRTPASASGDTTTARLLTTKPFVIAGESLVLSVNACVQPANAGGRLVVSLLQEGVAVAVQVSAPLSGSNGQNLAVKWLSAAMDLQRSTKYRLRFEMQQASLFSFAVSE
jgi:hypothetical protein